MHVGDPCMVKPCSQAAVHTVISHTQNVSAVGKDGNRKWTTLISDGVPYVFATYTGQCFDVFKMWYHD